MVIKNGVLAKVNEDDIINGKFEVPDGVTIIGYRAFEGCSGLTKITIPDGVTQIDTFAFEGCSGLKEITIPDGITQIGDWAFKGCSGLKEITIPDGVTQIGNWTFEGCRNLAINISYKYFCTLKHNFHLSIYLMNKIKKIEIEQGTETWSINEKEFEECKGLTEIKVPYNCSFKDKRAVFYGVDKFLEQEGFIIQDFSEKEAQDLTEKATFIVNNPLLRKSRNYNVYYMKRYVLKMFKVLGIENAYELSKIPENITEQELQKYGEKISKVYQPKYKLKGDLRAVYSLFESIDTTISQKCKDVKNNRNRFYTEFNQILESNKTVKIEELLGICASEIGLNLSENELNKIKSEIKKMQFTNKKQEIKHLIATEVNNPDYNVIQRGVSGTLLFNIIRNNILNDGKIEDIGEILNKELNKRREDGQFFYGESIRNQQEIYESILSKIYTENAEELNNDLVDILKNTKKQVGNRWILNLKKCKNNVKNIDKMSKDEYDIFSKELQELGINAEADVQFVLNNELSSDEIAEILQNERFEGVLTYEKLEQIFGSMTEDYSENFAIWFMQHKDEIIKNNMLCNEIYLIQNEFEEMLTDPIVRATFENGKLSIEKVIEIYQQKEKNVKEENEELGQIASKVEITQDELTTAEEIFEIAKKREGSYVPPVKSTQKHFRGRILRPDDPMVILAGNATNCCQRVGGEGQGSMAHAATEKNGAIFIVEELDKNGRVIKPVAQSWVWRNNDVVCFDNIEIPTSEQDRLKDNDGDIESQKEILQIYIDCAQNMLEMDKKMLSAMLKEGKITEQQYRQLVLKDIRVGVGYNDLGVLEKSGLEEVKVESQIYPKETDKEYWGETPWVDSGIDSVVGDGAQLILAKSDIERTNIAEQEKKEQLEEIPLLYKKQREVRKLKAGAIGKDVVRIIRKIEDITYRDRQKMLDDCEDYIDVADEYDINPENLQVRISRDSDWYVIYEERDDEMYIADLAMVNGVNSQKNEETKTDIIEQTYEMYMNIYEIMLEAAENGKVVRFEATEDTSYKNVQNLIKRGIAEVLEENQREWSKTRNDYGDDQDEDYYDEDYYDEEDYDDEYEYDEDYYSDNEHYDENYDETEKSSQEQTNEEVNDEPIIMYDMVIKINSEKMKDELVRIKQKLEKRKSKMISTNSDKFDRI